jgi:hypothetical protein
MAKQKKTRKQKALSDLRHKAPHSKRETPPSSELITEEEGSKSNIFTYTLQSTTASTTSAFRTTNSAEYSYIIHDLKKTALLTFAIVALQLMLYFFMNRP